MKATERAALDAYPDKAPIVLSERGAHGKAVLDALGGHIREVILFGHGPSTVPKLNRGLFPADAMWADVLPPEFASYSGIGYVYLPLSDSNGEPNGGSNKPAPDDILPLNMTGVKIVWYWACDTASGPVVFGEWIVGFPRAFLLAGSQSVLTSFVDVHTDQVALFSRLVHGCVWKKRLSPAQAFLCFVEHLAVGNHVANLDRFIFLIVRPVSARFDVSE